MSRHLSTRNISSKSMHAFLSNLANRQPDRQTVRQTRANALKSEVTMATLQAKTASGTQWWMDLCTGKVKEEIIPAAWKHHVLTNDAPLWLFSATWECQVDFGWLLPTRQVQVLHYALSAGKATFWNQIYIDFNNSASGSRHSIYIYIYQWMS